jgi:hypothetical protein
VTASIPLYALVSEDELMARELLALISPRSGIEAAIIP